MPLIFAETLCGVAETPRGQWIVAETPRRQWIVAETLWAVAETPRAVAETPRTVAETLWWRCVAETPRAVAETSRRRRGDVAETPRRRRGDGCGCRGDTAWGCRRRGDGHKDHDCRGEGVVGPEMSRRRPRRLLVSRRSLLGPRLSRRHRGLSRRRPRSTGCRGDENTAEEHFRRVLGKSGGCPETIWGIGGSAY